jgi:hypothetical protein
MQTLVIEVARARKRENDRSARRRPWARWTELFTECMLSHNVGGPQRMELGLGFYDTAAIVTTDQYE